MHEVAWLEQNYGSSATLTHVRHYEQYRSYTFYYTAFAEYAIASKSGETIRKHALYWHTSHQFDHLGGGVEDNVIHAHPPPSRG